MFCNICLEVLQTPVATPCGHIFCLECLISSSQKSPDAMKAPCPTCRTTFSLVSPDPAFVPEKYRSFIDSNIRRVYLDDSLETSLQQKVTQLESRVKSLEIDKSLLMVRCESHMAAATSNARREKEARLRCSALQEELKQANFCVSKLEKKIQSATFSEHHMEARRLRSLIRDDSSAPASRLLGGNDTGALGKGGAKLPSAISSSPDARQGTFRPTVPLPKRRRVSKEAHAGRFQESENVARGSH